MRFITFLSLCLVIASAGFSTELTSSPRKYPVYWVGKQKYVGLSALIKTLEIQSWGRIEDRIFFEYQGRTFKARIGSSELSVDDQKYNLEFPVKEVENAVLFPLDPLEKILSTVQPAPASPAPKVAEKARQPAPAKVEDVSYTPANLDKTFVILIDPGHGGHDDGARGNFGLKEKDVNLDIALRVKSYLAAQLKNCPKVSIKMSRDSDVFLSLDERVELAKKLKADIFFCIHTNSSRFNKWNADGFETYYPRRKEDISFSVPETQDEAVDTETGTVFQIVSDLNSTSVIEESRILAELVQENLAERLICPDRGAKSANFYVLKYTPMISVLVEVGFICNPNIEANLRDVEVREEISKTLCKAILQYLKQKNIIN